MKSYGKDAQRNSFRPSLEIFTDRKSTVAEIVIYLGTEAPNVEEFIGTGSSRRVKDDKYDERIGHLLAVYRAVEDVRAQLKKEVDKIH
jgi:Domain of unknown function (DUF1876)